VYKDGKKKGTDTIAIGKAFDDRTGAFVAAEVVRMLAEKKIKHPNTVIGAATTQEEVGLRGARTTAYVVKPDVCLTLEVDIAGDVPGIEPNEAPTKMGAGVALTTYDSSMIPNQGLLDYVIGTAEKAKIPYQLSGMAGGGTDAGAIHMVRAGCPSLVMGVPTRHIHSHVGILSLSDTEAAIKLIVEVVKKLWFRELDDRQCEYRFELNAAPDSIWLCFFRRLFSDLSVRIENKTLVVVCFPADLEPTYEQIKDAMAWANLWHAEERDALIEKVQAQQEAEQATRELEENRKHSLKRQFDELQI
jgi:hypothetical protein